MVFCQSDTLKATVNTQTALKAK